MKKDSEIITYDDLSYDEKRKILRRYAYKNGFAYEMKLYITDKILEGMSMKSILDLSIERMIDNLLTDGYVAYERIFNLEGTEIIAYDTIDPITLIVTKDTDNKTIWVQYPDNKNRKRILTEDQILYIVYPIINASDSLIGQLYTKQIKLYNHEKLNDFIITYIVKKLKEQLTDIIKYERNFFKK